MPNGDQKSAPAKPAGPQKAEDTLAEIFAVILVLMLVAAALTNAMLYVDAAEEWWEVVLSWILDRIIILVFISAFLSILALLAFLYYSFKYSALLEDEQEEMYQQQVLPAQNITNERWGRVLDHVDSDHPNDWRIAIIEADTILEDLLDRMGYGGDTIGDKLKQVEPSDFLTLDNAWEAHKVRNELVHNADHVISKRETERIIDLYRSVFEEFHFI